MTGTITLAYQTQRLTYADLDEERLLANSAASSHATDDLITDEHGRPLDLLYGFVCRVPSIRETHEADLTAARAEALRAYRRFLADETGFTLEISEPFVLRSVTSGPEKPSREIPPHRPTTRPPRPISERPPVATAAHPLPARRRFGLNPIIVALVVVIVSAIVWIVILLPERGPVEEVTVTGPEPGQVDCRAPVVFRATVRTNGRAEFVTYHWEGSTDKADPVRGWLTFDKDDTKPVVERKLIVRGSAGEKITGDQKLVVETPNRKEDSVDYSLICKGTGSG